MGFTYRVAHADFAVIDPDIESAGGIGADPCFVHDRSTVSTVIGKRYHYTVHTLHTLREITFGILFHQPCLPLRRRSPFPGKSVCSHRRDGKKIGAVSNRLPILTDRVVKPDRCPRIVEYYSFAIASRSPRSHRPLTPSTRDHLIFSTYRSLKDPFDTGKEKNTRTVTLQLFNRG